eukprot:scaffold15787_cov105-Skeletonema_dohrnii-CCMP3373.AAC.1
MMVGMYLRRRHRTRLCRLSQSESPQSTPLKHQAKENILPRVILARWFKKKWQDNLCSKI